MKINIRELAAKLFCAMEIALDLDTGELYIVQLHRDEVGNLKNFRILPNYSTAAIHQNYNLLVKSRLGIIPWEGWDQYPKFPLVENCDETEEMKEYIHNSHPFCEVFYYYKPLADVDDFEEADAHCFPTYEEFLRGYACKFARAWCDREGYEWYDVKLGKEWSAFIPEPDLP